jgi:hypothetical protein
VVHQRAGADPARLAALPFESRQLECKTRAAAREPKVGTMREFSSQCVGTMHRISFARWKQILSLLIGKSAKSEEDPSLRVWRRNVSMFK